jgi:choline-glycine betaine transporter
MLCNSFKCSYGAFFRIVWAPFVGIFVAKISKGRTLNELFMGFFVTPSLFCVLWFSTWGGIGLRQHRQGMELEQLGLAYFNDSTTFVVDGSQHCYHVPQQDVIVNGTVVFHNHLPGVTPVCQFDPSKSTQALFNVFYSFSYPEVFTSGLGPVLTIITLFTLALYFVTSFDSAILVMHYLSSNGKSTSYLQCRCICFV